MSDSDYQSGLSKLTQEIVRISRKNTDLEADLCELILAIPSSDWAIIMTKIPEPSRGRVGKWAEAILDMDEIGR